MFGGNLTEWVSLKGTAVGHVVLASLLKQGYPRAHGMEPPAFQSVPILVLTH